MIADITESIDASAATTTRTFRYTEAEEAGKILTDAEVTVVLQGAQFQPWKNFVDHGDFLGAQGRVQPSCWPAESLPEKKISDCLNQCHHTLFRAQCSSSSSEGFCLWLRCMHS